MSIYSTITDFSARIRNAYKARKLEVSIKKSTKIINILKVLQDEGFIRGFSIEEKTIKVFLKYLADKPVISKIEPISISNKNKFISIKNLIQLKEIAKKNNQGLGLFILSTSKGILSDYKSIEKNVGGQIILRVL